MKLNILTSIKWQTSNNDGAQSCLLSPLNVAYHRLRSRSLLIFRAYFLFPQHHVPSHLVKRDDKMIYELHL